MPPPVVNFLDQLWGSWDTSKQYLIEGLNQLNAQLANQEETVTSNAASLTTGTLADARLSSNVALLPANNTFTGDITVARAESGNVVSLFLKNTSNTAASDSRVRLEAGGTGGGDPTIQFVVPATTAWVVGLDNSDADAFKIGTAGLGTADKLKLTTSGLLTVANGIIERGRSVALGEWVSYTPQWSHSGYSSARTLGNSTISGKYTIIGKTVFFLMTWAFGSTSTQGTGGSYIWSLPVTANWGSTGAMTARILDAGTQHLLAVGYLWDSDWFTLLENGNVSAGIGPNKPFAWSSGDSIVVEGFYEMA